jgi:hypothetical protein
VRLVNRVLRTSMTPDQVADLPAEILYVIDALVQAHPKLYE